ncbi:calcium-dependent cysteine protease, putative [Ixodes scapularis]|uniref:Calcium-dependent cysteine protease, putative n=1 Tax=Ixodes scapularis TaxID=6945 RepID=B7P5Y9_IXOSC|nr:calcium-dependent cysteine protease, putative [Ixodes scapularis]|eukprot:XP_002408101.1 calcium-dependent cysteine protease, putative [Ixodes scapularis]
MFCRDRYFKCRLFRFQLPETVYYVPEFISENEERYLFEKVYDAPKPKWVQLAHRRLQNWGGLPHPKGMLSEPLPPWLVEISSRVASLGVFGDKKPNHVLVNEYKPGEGILPHEDGPLYHPVVTNITLNSHTVLDFYRPRKVDKSGQESDEDKDCEKHVPVGSLLLQPRSLLVTRGAMYTDHLHGIEARTKDAIDDGVVNLSACGVVRGAILERGTRVSLTIRVVPKVIRANILRGLSKK